MACSGTSRGFMNGSQKSEAVCRAGRRVERNRCAVRKTARGSAAPGMACRDRPVESSPQLGAFPTVGIPPRSGGQVGIWTGLIIPAPIWREGMDSPSGCEIMDDVTKGARPYAPLPPPPSGRLANRPSRPRAERPIQSTNPTGFDHPADGKADPDRYQKIRPSQGASRTVTIPAIIITMLDTTPSALPI